jgi:hypothetical protein
MYHMFLVRARNMSQDDFYNNPSDNCQPVRWDLNLPVFLLLRILMSRFWKSATVAVSMLVFATLMSSLTRVRIQDALLGTAA